MTGRDNDLIRDTQDALSRVLQREGLDQKCLVHVMRCLARVAGSHFPVLQVFEESGCGQAELGVVFVSTNWHREILVPMLAETWAWLLVDGQDGQRLHLKVDSANDDDVKWLKTLADCTMGFLKRCPKKHVARDCCSALGVLAVVGQDMLSLLPCIVDFLVRTIEDFQGHPEVVSEGVRVLIGLCKERGELFSLDLSPKGSWQHNRGALSEYLCEKAMDLALTLQCKTDLHNDVVKPIFKLLTHTHSWDQVVRFVCIAKHRPSSEMILCAMDEIHESLRPIIRLFRGSSKDLEVTHEDVCNVAMERRNWAISALRTAQKHGGIGVEALTSLSLSEHVNDQLFVDWSQGASLGELQDRFFIVGLLFDAQTLEKNLMPFCWSPDLFIANCGALVALDSLVPLTEPLKRDIARSIVKIPAPPVPSTCTAWVRVIGMAFKTSSGAQEDSDHLHLAQLAGRAVKKIIWEVLICSGWESFIPVALVILQGLVAHEDLQDLVEHVHQKNAVAASSCRLAQEILADHPQ